MHIQERMPIYTIYNLQHAIHLAKKIESQIKSQRQRNFDDVIKKLDEIQNLSKKWRVTMKVPKDVPMSSLIVKEEDSHELPEENVQFIIDLRFQSDKLFENVRDVSLEEKISAEDNDIIDLFDNF